MPEKTVDSGGKRYTLNESGGTYSVYRSGSKIGSARSETEALNIIKSHSGGDDVNIGGTGCFPSSARVLTSNGYRSIAQFFPGDTVLSYDPYEGKIAARVVRN